jgi:hypothetical protein
VLRIKSFLQCCGSVTFCVLLFEGTFTSYFSEIKSHKKVTKHSRNLTIFAWW